MPVVIKDRFRGTVLRTIDADTLENADLRDADLTRADLTRADLRDADLRDANLTRADLRDADLRDANLTGADLRDADLRDANLTGANLTRANLTRADLTDADLTGANLTGANLTDANLTGANLTDANLTGANLTGADLTGADLTDAKIDLVFATNEESIANLDWVREFILKDTSRLAMDSWHGNDEWESKTPEEVFNSCGTTHCLAGGLQALSDNPEIRKIHASLAGLVLAPVANKMFHKKEAEVLQWLTDRKYVEELEGVEKK